MCDVFLIFCNFSIYISGKIKILFQLLHSLINRLEDIAKAITHHWNYRPLKYTDSSVIISYICSKAQKSAHIQVTGMCRLNHAGVFSVTLSMPSMLPAIFYCFRTGSDSKFFLDALDLFSGIDVAAFVIAFICHLVVHFDVEFDFRLCS